jgi:putative aldouronate transport system permease protein
MPSRGIRMTNGERVFTALNILIMLALVVITLYPLLYVLFAALSVPSRLMTNYGVLLGPQGFSLVSFAAVFKNPNIWSGYKNTLIIVIGGTALNMVMTVLGGYVLSRKGWFLTRPIALAVVFTMYFHGGLIPFYLTVRGVGLRDTLLALIIPTAINTYNMMIMRTAMVTIPPSLEESAKLDGAGHITILARIIAPLIMPTLAVLLLYYGVEHWNAWFNAMIFLRKRSMFPLQLILREILIQNNTTDMGIGSSMTDQEMVSETIKYAVIIVSTVPILLLYPFLQRYFVKGVMVGAVKG